MHTTYQIGKEHLKKQTSLELLHQYLVLNLSGFLLYEALMALCKENFVSLNGLYCSNRT